LGYAYILYGEKIPGGADGKRMCHNSLIKVSFRGSAEESLRTLVNPAFSWRALVSLGITNSRNLAKNGFWRPFHNAFFDFAIPKYYVKWNYVFQINPST